MKKLLFLLIIGMVGFAPLKSFSQVSLNVNIGSQPLWGPVGYDHVDYYYLPDIDSYYNVPQRQFVYLDGGRWIFANSLPARYSSYNLYSGYKVVMNSPKPYLYYKDHKVKYAGYKGKGSQPIILKSNNPKYFVAKGHPKHGKQRVAIKSGGNGNAKMKFQGNGGGKGNSKGNGNGKGKH